MTATSSRHFPPHRPFRADQRGIAAVEFAMLVPVFVLLLVGIGDFTSIFYRKLQLSSAVAAGAQYALAKGQVVQATAGSLPVSTYLSNITDIVQHATSVTPTVNTTTGVLYNDANNANSFNSCYCANAAGTDIVLATCGAYCSTVAGTAAGDSSIAGSFVKITASLTYTPPLSAAWVSGGTFTETAWVRVQ